MYSTLLILSVFLGGGLYFLLNRNQKLTGLLLSFSGSFLLAISIIHMMPEAYIATGKTAGLFVFAGLFIQITLEGLTQGIEHGHKYIDHKEEHRSSLGLYIGLWLHAFLEGMPIGHNHSYGAVLFWGIVIHKLVVSMVLVSVLKHYEIKNFQLLLFVLLFACASPLGYIITLKYPLHERYMFYITALVAGMFLHISTTIWFESSKGHHLNLWNFLMLVLAIVAAWML